MRPARATLPGNINRIEDSHMTEKVGLEIKIRLYYNKALIMQNGVSRLKFEKLSVSGICWFLLQIFFKTSKKKKKKKQTKRISRFE